MESASGAAAPGAVFLATMCLNLEASEFDGMIDDAVHSTVDRDGLLELWEATFTEADTHKELCRPCTLAVLDAAGHGEADRLAPDGADRELARSRDIWYTMSQRSSMEAWKTNKPAVWAMPPCLA